MSRRDDILKRKQAYEDAYSRRRSEHTGYTKMRYSVLNKLTELVKSKIGDTSLNLNVSSDQDFGGQITVTVNNGNNPHDEQALNWNWSVSLTPEGEIKRDSGSWSGLSAITPQHLENLKESVRVLKETPKQYTVEEINEDDVSDESRWPMSYRIPKETFMQLISTPLQTVEV